MEFSALKLRNRRTISAFSCAFRAIPASASARAGCTAGSEGHGADDVDKKQPVPVRREVQTQTGAPDDKRAGEDLRELVAPERAENLRHDSGDGDAVDEQQPGIPVTDREDLRAAE